MRIKCLLNSVCVSLVLANAEFCFSPLTRWKLEKLVKGVQIFVCFPQAKYISQCIDEIKQELKQDNIAVKANAVCKLTYVSALLGSHGIAAGFCSLLLIWSQPWLWVPALPRLL